MSDTTSVVMFPTVVFRAAISTPSTVPETAIFPVTDTPALVVSNFLLLSWYNSTAPFPINLARFSPPPGAFSKAIVLDLTTKFPVPPSSMKEFEPS